MELWIVGEVISFSSESKDQITFIKSIRGIYDSREKALEICVDKHGFVAPLILNDNPDEDGSEEIEWEGFFYPNA